MKDAIDLNDFAYIESRKGKIIRWFPGAVEHKTGKINPHATVVEFVTGEIGAVLHVKPVYYETMYGTWRPISEVTTYAGNHKIIFNEFWWKVHPRYMQWLEKRMILLNGRIAIPSIFSAIPSPYTGILRSLHQSFIPPKIGLLTATVYPDPNPETVTVDGHADFDFSSVPWGTMRVATIAAAASDTSSTIQQYVGNYNNGVDNYWLYRSFVLFDSSILGAGALISAATFSGYCTTKVDDDLSLGSSKSIRLVQTTPASNTAITTDDFEQTGTTAGATDKTVASFSTAAYNDFALNATGISWISPIGITKLGMRHTADIDNTTPNAPGAADDYSLMYISSADVADTTQDPKLFITYTPGANSKSPSGGVAYSGGVQMY